jgi:hypothetical protein
MEMIRVKTKSGKIINKKVDYITDFANGKSIAFKGDKTYSICERDFDGAIWIKD